MGNAWAFISLLSLTHTFRNQCPQDDVSYESETIKEYTEVESWNECAQKCRSFSPCYAWTWFNENNVAQKRSNHCYLKNR